MKVYYVQKLTSFGDFECPAEGERVSDYFQSEENAKRYMRNHFPSKSYEDSWGTIGIASEDITIH